MNSVLTGDTNWLFSLLAYSELEYEVFVQTLQSGNTTSDRGDVGAVPPPAAPLQLTRLSGIDTWHEKRCDFQLPVAASITPLPLAHLSTPTWISRSPAPPKVSPPV